MVAGSSTLAFKFQNQYYLTMSSLGPGSVTPVSAWYNAGARTVIKATAVSGHKFVSWIGTGVGSYTGTATTATITVNSAISETANFT